MLDFFFLFFPVPTTPLSSQVVFVTVAVLVSAVEAVVGGVARLPCDLTPPLPGDQVWLVIWYREGNAKPCYRYNI